jgi:hypothetical protein
MMVGALAGPVSFRMQCLYHDSYCAAILVIAIAKSSGWHRGELFRQVAGQIWEVNLLNFADP